MAFSSLTMKIESTAPTAVSSVQPGRTGSFKSLSLAGPGAGCRPSSSHLISSTHSSFPGQGIVPSLSLWCCHPEPHPPDCPSPMTDSLSLTNVFPFWPARQHWAGRPGGVAKLFPQLAQLRQSDRACSEPCRHAATCCVRLHAEP